jgi:hypothetical protein
VRPSRVVRRRWVTGSPPHRSGSRRGEGLPGCGDVLCVRAMVEHPAGYGPRLAHNTEKPWLPSGTSGPWASGKVRGCGAACPMAHTFACLRITEAMSDASARLATGSGGLTLGRAGFAPTGRHPTCHESLASSSPHGPALPGRTAFAPHERVPHRFSRGHEPLRNIDHSLRVCLLASQMAQQTLLIL